MRRFFSKKHRVIITVWTIVAIILLVLVNKYKGSDAQGTMSIIVWCYLGLSCVLAGAVAYIAKKSK